MSWSDLQRLKPVAPSMGMMLETTSTRLFTEPGQAALRLARTRIRRCGCACWRTPAGCGVRSPPGILVGIGEDAQERLDSILAIRRVAREYGSVQECIVQNFRAKDDTAMRSTPDLGAGGVPRHDRGDPAAARPVGLGAGAAEPVRPADDPAAAGGRASTTGAGSRP